MTFDLIFIPKAGSMDLLVFVAMDLCQQPRYHRVAAFFYTNTCDVAEGLSDKHTRFPTFQLTGIKKL